MPFSWRATAIALFVAATLLPAAAAGQEQEPPDERRAPRIEWGFDCRPIVSFVEAESYANLPSEAQVKDSSGIDLTDDRLDAEWLLRHYSVRPDRGLLRRYLSSELRRFEAVLSNPSGWGCDKPPIAGWLPEFSSDAFLVDQCKAEAEKLLEHLTDMAALAHAYADVLVVNPTWPETLALKRRWLGLSESATAYFKARLGLEERRGGGQGDHYQELDRFYRVWIALGVELGLPPGDLARVGERWALYLDVDGPPTDKPEREFWPFGADARDNPMDSRHESITRRMSSLSSALSEEWALQTFMPDRARANRFIDAVTRWEGEGAPWGDLQGCGYRAPLEALVAMQTLRVSAARDDKEVSALFVNSNRGPSVVEQLRMLVYDQRVLLRREVWRTAARALVQAEARLNAGRPQWKDTDREVPRNKLLLCRAAEVYEMGPSFDCPARR